MQLIFTWIYFRDKNILFNIDLLRRTHHFEIRFNQQYGPKLRKAVKNIIQHILHLCNITLKIWLFLFRNAAVSCDTLQGMDFTKWLD